MKNFDFDEWKELAERDPVAFEARRKSTIAEAIANTRHPERHTELQNILEETIISKYEPLESAMILTEFSIRKTKELEEHLARIIRIYGGTCTK
jgi:Protein of unknown function (DUF3135)